MKTLKKPSVWPEKTPKNIIVRMPNWIGDAVMATPILADLKSYFPNSKVTAMCLASIGSLLEKDPHIDEIFIFQRPSGWLHRIPNRDILQPLRHSEYDLGILLTNSLSSAWWFWRGNVKNRLGYATDYRNLLLNQAIPLPPNLEKQHLVITYKMLLEPLGIPLSNTIPQLYLANDEILAAEELLKKYGISKNTSLIGINPGAAYGSAKCWLPERFENLTKRLLEDPTNSILYFGDNVTAPLVHSICKNFPQRVINLAGKTNLRELMALISLCKVFLTNDSGPMHIAAALKTPLLALFGSTNEVKTRPYQFGNIIHKHTSCSPCYLRVCPIDFPCMKEIEVEEVYQELQKLLKHYE